MEPEEGIKFYWGRSQDLRRLVRDCDERVQRLVRWTNCFPMTGVSPDPLASPHTVCRVSGHVITPACLCPHAIVRVSVKHRRTDGCDSEGRSDQPCDTSLPACDTSLCPPLSSPAAQIELRRGGRRRDAPESMDDEDGEEGAVSNWGPTDRMRCEGQTCMKPKDRIWS